MQAQQTRSTTLAITQTQSLAAVQTLLRAGLGAITFLRNLLPEDNFTPNHLTTIDDSSEQSLSQTNGSQESIASRRNVNGFKIMTITRGYTDEADRILNYLEYGIFDALENRYLRSFIFAIYLDNKDPNNIVEAYTFNFKYHALPGSDVSIPVMSLVGGQDKKKAYAEDPVARAIRNGKAPTLKDVKMSVKAMLKTLIQTMHHMDSLPRRRFATFKVFYTDETPSEYEPPNFQAGDVEKDKWFFMTHDLDEIPERCSIGKIDTGHHSIKLSVTSIASYLPSSTEHDNATFSGTTIHPGRPTLTPLQEAANCKNQADKQLVDAEHRNHVWPVDDSAELDADAEGDDDDEYVKHPDGHYVKIDSISPIGVRNKSGYIEALPVDEQTVEAHFSGLCEDVPRHLHEIVAKEIPGNFNIEETQPLFLTPKKNASKPLSTPSSGDRSMLSPNSTAPTTPAVDFDVDLIKNMSLGTSGDCDNEMLDLETQALPRITSPLESIQSFRQDVIQVRGTKSATVGRQHELQDHGLQCDCDISLEDMCCYCEGGCKRWFHVWCVGYHSDDDPRMPSKFICFDCRVRADITWELIKIDLYPRMLSKYKDLALIRRAIKVAQNHSVKKFTSFQFLKEFGGDVILAGQMLKRLEVEEFVLRESTVLDDMGLTITSHSKKGKNNKSKGAGKHAKTRKNIQRPRYVFNEAILVKNEYLDYFKPDDQDVENLKLGISEMVSTLLISF
ncbi:hypothetical protein GALMADRAFT_617548 [Galerina marginata CBS 339.88]|uniref:HORMA domain-containing protein n=1 Tax=Galerina marginata (strain CBS 339.88) TaxID=685588 RepID=A0A067T0V4_GALM3|nr:hypothetical protein GALMADRAFT_617548 [Galerina marginata CBS 339.88]